MDTILIFLAGVVVGGFVCDVNLRAPEPVKKWLASWFPKSNPDA